MSWTITEDHINEAKYTSVGVAGHGLVVSKETPGAKRFHLLDDDGGLYFSGWLVDDDECPSGYCAWESAYSWGEYDSGTTNITDGNHQSVIG